MTSYLSRETDSVHASDIRNTAFHLDIIWAPIVLESPDSLPSIVHNVTEGFLSTVSVRSLRG